MDFGSQYTQLIARRVRELNVYSEIRAWSNVTSTLLEEFSPRCIILSGGPESLLNTTPPRIHPDVFTWGVPVLGICYGMQLMASQLHGTIDKSSKQEFGRTQVRLLKPTPLFEGLDKNLDVWMSHGDKVEAMPAGFETIAASANSSIGAMADERRHLYGVQFHPEVTHTRRGARILRNFIVKIAGCTQQWQPENIVNDLIAHIRGQVGSTEEVVLGLSGGVDSSVTAMLLQRALGNRLHCLFIDTGLLRLGEANQVVSTFQRQASIDLLPIPAAETFLRALRDVHDPEAKRRIIGNLFVEIFEKHARRFNNVQWLAQGTIYPDVIESRSGADGCGPADQITPQCRRLA